MIGGIIKMKVPKNRLIEQDKTYDSEDFADHVRSMASWIEDSMLEGGAIPGKDYTLLDCYKMAVEYRKSIATNNVAEALKEVSSSIISNSSSVDNVAEKIGYIAMNMK